MAPSRTAYDPIVSVEGMYKGSLTRLGYFFKDPKSYGEATLAVLRQTAKRYDDALDDCLIQILDAKWLLEHQLAQNQARRAREAAEKETSSNKRKLETASERLLGTNEVQTTDKNPAKRMKTQHSPLDAALPAQQIHVENTNDAQGSEVVQKAEVIVSDSTKLEKAAAEETVQNHGQRNGRDSPQATRVHKEKSNKATEKPQEKLAADSAQTSKEQSEQAEQPAPNEDELESMSASAPTANDKNNDLNFDLNLNASNLADSNPLESTAHDANNLELLPGLESYANASGDGDEFSTLNVPASTADDHKGMLASNNNFGLPEIQGDSNFNDLFADGDFGGDASLMDLDLEDGFFNT